MKIEMEIHKCTTDQLIDYLFYHEGYCDSWRGKSYEDVDAVLSELCNRHHLNIRDYASKKDAYHAINRAHAKYFDVDFDLSPVDYWTKRDLPIDDDELYDVTTLINRNKARTVYYDTRTGHLTTEDIRAHDESDIDIIIVEINPYIKKTQDLIDTIVSHINFNKMMDDLFWHPKSEASPPSRDDLNTNQLTKKETLT